MNRDYWPTQAWRAADPEAVGMAAEPLSTLHREIEARYPTVNAFLVVRSGYLVFERYYNGFGPHDKHILASVTKSVISALIGVAIDRGYIESVQQPVLEFFPEYVPSPHDPLKRQITIEHLLTMTSGFAWRSGARAHELLVDRMRRSENWVQFVLDIPVRERSFGSFQYNSGATHVLSAIITRSTGRCAEEFAAEQLFAPLGIEPPAPDARHTFSQEDVFRNKAGGWPKDPQGNSIGGWGLVLKPRDMARFGYLYLNRGLWDGQQIVPEQWVEDSLTAHTPLYGYQWWLRKVNGVCVFSAVGQGGQHIFGLPEMDLVVAVASKMGSRWRDCWRLLEKHVIPAVVG